MRLRNQADYESAAHRMKFIEEKAQGPGISTMELQEYHKLARAIGGYLYGYDGHE